MLDLERPHLESIEVILRMGEMCGNGIVEEIKHSISIPHRETEGIGKC